MVLLHYITHSFIHTYFIVTIFGDVLIKVILKNNYCLKQDRKDNNKFWAMR